jgi:hypothetical protein
MITQSELKELLEYDPNTGIFTWKVNRGTARIGNNIKCVDNKGYIVVRINSKNYNIHRLAFLYMTGEWPKEQVDHISGDRSDNRWSNLRDVSCRDNACNQHTHRNGRLPGCYWHKGNRKWRAQISINGIIRCLGYFTTEEEANHAYLKAKANLDA